MKLKITFVLPFVNLTGGIKILFEHANRLAHRGHQVTIVYPGVLFHGSNYERANSSLRWRLLEEPLRRLKYWLFVEVGRKTEADWFPLAKQIRLKRTPDLSARYVPQADIVIATAPETVNFVADYPADKGQKVHFAQDYEVWYLPEKFVDQTLSHKNLHLITIGHWQKKLFTEQFGRKVEAIIPDGVDLTRFKPKAIAKKADGRPIRILMSYHHAPYKGIADGLAAIEAGRQAGFSIQTVMYGVHPLQNDVPAEVEYHYNVAEADLPNLFRSCDIFLWPTKREGFGLPPLEAMACGIPVVGTNAGAMTDYMIDGQTGYIVPVEKPEALATKLILLLKNPALRERMAASAAKAALAWDWETQTDKLETYLTDLHQKGTNDSTV